MQLRSRIVLSGAACSAIFALGSLCCAAGSESDEPQPAKTSAGHWAFQPVRRPTPPAVNGAARTDIDRFILAALESRGHTLNPEADRATLIRRVCFDLTGLPPTLAEIDAFVNDRAADTYERMVERYLASPHYGERWGKYWLDAAGYADSNGYFDADSNRPFAWRYRDYVVRAFNQDKPYDRFVTEQLAGDELAGYQPDGDVTPAMIDLLTATHFLRNAPDGTGESDGNPDEVRIDRYTVLEGTLQITMNALLGVTIQCARCHKHKFEPISNVEYYRLQAIFFPVYNPERWKAPKDRVVDAGTKSERTEWKRKTDMIDRQIKALKDGLTAFAQPLREQAIEERLMHLPAATRSQVIQAVNTPEKKRSREQQALLKEHAKAVAVSDDELAKRFPEFAALRDQVKNATAAREKDRPPPLTKLAVFVETDPNPPAHHVLRRGQHNQPAEEVEPGVVAAFTALTNAFRIEPRPAGIISTGRRTAFARWVTSPDNPLLARVMVNRIWQQHFGTGLVATPDNLGQSGAKPSHPELLDYLASEFVRGGWSVKAMHRLILRSAVYRQASAPRDDLASRDPDNRLLGHFPLRRLDAEALRDAMLSVAGELDLRVGGPYVASKRNSDGVVEVPENQEGSKRRSLYLQQRRTQVVTMLQLFDAPAIAVNCGVRPTSTVPLQALALLNSDFARARAKAFAQRLTREAGNDAEQRLMLAFRLAYGRPAHAEETEAARRFLAIQAKVYGEQADRDAKVWTDFCQMILASNAFLYVE
jgi:Protein of unknown function (DUF1553)/Protein of unknown function (DUF1549)